MVTTDTPPPGIVTIGTRVALPGFHRWPGATGRRAYLADRHRHLFGIVVEVYVGHDDRDVEFHDLQDMIRHWWSSEQHDVAASPEPRECGSDSCETLARKLADHLTAQLGNVVAAVTVTEDDESWATYRHQPNPLKNGQDA